MNDPDDLGPPRGGRRGRRGSCCAWALAYAAGAALPGLGLPLAALVLVAGDDDQGSPLGMLCVLIFLALAGSAAGAWVVGMAHLAAWAWGRVRAAKKRSGADVEPD